jgi:hypothetical protein
VPRRIAVSIDLDELGRPVSHYWTHEHGVTETRRSIVAIAEKGLHDAAIAGYDHSPALTSYLWSLNADARVASPSTPSVDPMHSMLACAEWLAASATPLGDAVVWRYGYASYHNTSEGWRSGHAQGQAIRLFLRVADATKCEKWRDLAVQAVKAYGISVDQGGFTLDLGRRRWWFAKFADSESTERFVLNGMLFALRGLVDAADAGIPEARVPLRRGARAVRALLPRFDAPAGSLYDLAGKRASAHYHRIQTELLSELPTTTRSRRLRALERRWRAVDVEGARGGVWESNPVA